MPAALSYPGVYIEEVPSGVRTIVGVPTSIAAFVGRTQRGKKNVATVVNGFADFERAFGGLWNGSQLGFAVRDFFANGGGQAVVVRVVGAKATPAKLTAAGLKLVAISEGSWGAGLRLSVDVDGVTPEIAAALGVAQTAVFNVTIADSKSGGLVERFLNVTVVDSARRIDHVLADESALAIWDGAFDPTTALTLPAAGSSTGDAVSAAAKKLADAETKLTNTLIADPDPAAAKNDIDARDKAKKDLADAGDAAGKAVSDGDALSAADFLPKDGQSSKLGLYALEDADIFNILCVPPYKTADTVNFDVDLTVVSAATAYCEKRRAIYIIDPPSNWKDKTTALAAFRDTGANAFPGLRHKNAALYFPRVLQANPLHEDRLETFAPCGLVAGIYARTDTQRGVWKAPAGLEATLNGVAALRTTLTDGENGELNKVGVNCLRAFPAAGRVVWGARTLRGDDQLADEWKYVPVRRTALFIEESLFRGTQWVVFEPNDEPLWAQIRLNVGAFMHGLFRQGAFQGTTPRDAYFVKCDRETTTQDDINKGIVNIVVGFAPLKPAEFVVIKLQQMAGQIQA